MGALSPDELTGALRARADVVAWREGFVAAIAAHPDGDGRARARQAGLRHGAARHARRRRGDRGGRGGRRRARAWSWSAR